jgi:Flp pilus assembly protein TadG
MFRKFWKDSSGASAVVLAVSALPVMLGAGMAVDVAVNYRLKAEIQSALDAAVLATAASGKDEATSIAEGKAVFAANFDAEAAGFNVTPTITIGNGKVTGSVDTTMPTSFMKLAGVNDMDLTGLAEVVLPGLGKAEVAFVLDYSSSMDDQYEAMRDAVVALIDKITNNRTSSDVKIGLVPFAREVYATLPGEYVVDGTMGIDWTNCTIDRKWPWTVNDETPTNAVASKWGRTDDDDVIDPNEYDDCPNYPTNGLVVRPLSTDHAGTVAQMQAMTPYSGTNLALGMQFGWQVLSPNAPWTEGVAYTDTSWRKILILLSDGKHNKDGFGPAGIHTEEQGFENVDTVCTAAKAKGITVVTVAYELDDEEGKEQLQRCASQAQYYLEGSEENIAEVFDGIGNLLARNAYLSR